VVAAIGIINNNLFFANFKEELFLFNPENGASDTVALDRGGPIPFFNNIFMAEHDALLQQTHRDRYQFPFPGLYKITSSHEVSELSLIILVEDNLSLDESLELQKTNNIFHSVFTPA
jgi:hypothetical protein